MQFMTGAKRLSFFIIMLLVIFTADVISPKSQHKKKKMTAKKTEAAVPPWENCGKWCLSSIFNNDLTNLSIPDIKGELMDIAVDGDYAYLLVQNFNYITDAIFKINRFTGKTKFIWGIGRHYATAIECSRGFIWILSKSKKYFLRKVSQSGKRVSDWGVATIPDGIIHGISTDGEQFFFSASGDSGSDLFSFNCGTGTIKKIGSFAGRILSLAYLDNRIYAYQEDFDTYAGEWLLVIDPRSGLEKRMRYFNEKSLGLASNGRNLFSLEQRHGEALVFPIAVLAKRNRVLGNPRIMSVEISYPIVSRNQHPYSADIWIPYPISRKYQNVRKVIINPRPEGIITDRYGNKWAHLRWAQSTGNVRAVLTFDILTVAVAYTIDKDYICGEGDIPETIAASLAETYSFDISNYVVKSHSTRIEMPGPWIYRIQAVQDYVYQAIINTGVDEPWSRASEYLYKGKGDFYGHTISYAALARTFGIPTRAVGGIILTAGKQEGNAGYTWNQVYCPRIGWVDIDLSIGRDGHNENCRCAIGYRPGDYYVTFAGDYDKTDYGSVFAQRDWSRVYRWSSILKNKNADVALGKISVKTVKLKK